MWSLYITILVSGFISAVHTQTCPSEEDLYPCRCEEDRFGYYIHVKCSSFLSTRRNSVEILRKALNSLTGKIYVDLRFENFNISIPSNIFSGIGIRDLRFHFCRMDSLTNDDQPVFLGLENHLDWLNIYDSSTVIAKLNVGHLKKLRRIELVRNNVVELGDDWFGNGPSSMETLVIQENNITKIGNNAFSQLNHLGALYLTGNRFGNMKRSMFPITADRLKILFLDNNGITHLPADIFSGMSSLDHISLELNGITTLDESTWSSIWQQLSRIDLYGNNIVCDDRLNWILKSKKRPMVFGQCSAPKEFENMSLGDFLNNRSQ